MNRSADILVRFRGRRNAKADKNVRALEKCEMRTRKLMDIRLHLPTSANMVPSWAHP